MYELTNFFKYYKKSPVGRDLNSRSDIIEYGWEKYFFFFYCFNLFMKPFPELRLKIINTLIPVFMKKRKKAREAKES